NYFEGYHWEEIPNVGEKEYTENYCRTFVERFVAFELGKAFSITTSKVMGDKIVTSDNRTLFEYLEDVWEDNKMYPLVQEIGQVKSVTGDAWVHPSFTPVGEDLDDPYNEYPLGRLSIHVLPSQNVIPEYSSIQRDKLTKFTILYVYEREIAKGFFQKSTLEKVVYKQIWTKDEITTIDGVSEPVTIPNKYGLIPFVQIKNRLVAGKQQGVSDLEDIIPINTEFNMKKSNVSEIIDYHSAPVTIVYGAKIGNLEKGANKIWGGLSKDARVENLELKGELAASNSYISSVKTAMCEVGGIPEGALGATQHISNTSGVAFQFMNLPLIEKTRLKRQLTESGLEELNKMIILISLIEGLIFKPEDVSNRDFYKTEVSIPDTLPKDSLMTLQELQQEMRLGFESRFNAMKRMGKENIESLIAEIDKDKEKNPQGDMFP
ncbi:MAG: phage portal protein, partial [Spirochaetia bacterium]|nr:phage portal protein [Spirochaetia bacterium]